MLRPQKGNSGVLFNDTLLNFGLWGVYTVHRRGEKCIHTVYQMYKLCLIQKV